MDARVWRLEKSTGIPASRVIFKYPRIDIPRRSAARLMVLCEWRNSITLVCRRTYRIAALAFAATAKTIVAAKRAKPPLNRRRHPNRISRMCFLKEEAAMTSASKAIVFSVLFLTALLAPAIADPLEDATNAYIKGDYTIALRLVRPLAERGNAVAQHNLGLMYAKGHGVPQDDAEALKWYHRAAEQGFAPAQSNLGLMYAKGQSVPQDDAEALKWYRRAADQGYAIAQYNLGVRFREGLGVPRNNVRAYMWFMLAKWYGLDPEPSFALAVTSLDMTPVQIAEAERLAREWKPTKPRPPQGKLPGAV